MKEYIEREELINNLKQFAPEHLTPLIVNLIQKQPAADVVSRSALEQIKWEHDEAFDTLERHGLSLGSNVDVVEVVRCKDCKHFIPFKKNVFCKGDCSCDNGLGNFVRPDDYCSYGVRKEGE